MKSRDSEQIQFSFLPLTVSIETQGGISTPLVLRGTPLPVKRSRSFSTAADNQEQVEIVVLLGESPLASKNIKIGSCLLQEIPPAKRGEPEIIVTFEVDKFCNVKGEAIEKKSGRKLETTLMKMELRLTDELIKRLISEAKETYEEDDARAVIAEVELRVRRDQEQRLVTETTKKMEKLIADIGIALTDGDMITVTQETGTLRKLLEQSQPTYAGFDFGDLFGGLFGPKTIKREVPRQSKKPQGYSRTITSEPSNSLARLSTSTTALIQSFLERIDPELELKREGAWGALDSNRPDSRVQASHSMREVLRLLLGKLAPIEEVQKAPWYKKPEGGSPVTRAMRIRYALSGNSKISSESAFSLIHDLAAAVDSMYAKLSAESHTDKKATITATRMYLAACEALIGLIAIERER